ncbi:MAG TPA: hypothetical protein ENN90_01855 [Mariniphaga anaerophila]|uniref:Auto-transporter adhesin head GIN domain-containing protein n=1 Tax=Mariniphaga anaerophila TaxID=1484053 RepID=A0A831LFN8_9BACT|nr:hypothetical protein [Mariniphaga anaerophila]
MDLLMKRLLPTCFLLLAVTFTQHAGTPVIFEKPDTVTVHSTGRYNRVIIDSIHLKDSLNEAILSPVKGKITQTGENNRVEINTGGETPKNKHQKTINKSQTNYKIQTTKTKQAANAKPATSNVLERSENPDISSGEPATSNLQPATIKVTQSGKNNRVKINSR